MKKISIIVPMYNESQMVSIFFEQINHILNQLKNYETEIIAVNDGSHDTTYELLLSMKLKYSNIGVVNLSRNFGHEAAVSAGLHYATGDAIIVMDADLQDPPEIILQMVEKWEQGYDVVNAKRSSRDEDSLLKRWTAMKFYQLINHLSGKVYIPQNVGNYRLISRRILDELNALPEKNRVFRILVPSLGYRTTEIEFVRPKRAAGQTHYNWPSMIRLAIDGITSATTIPLKLATNIGLIVAFIGLSSILLIVYEALFTNKTVTGWASTVSIILFMGGIQLICLGVIGEYIARIFIEVKNRPVYHTESFSKPSESIRKAV
ncbi:glycosyltransferase family 2 protein [Heliophilum fasciatum]|uniref:Dolichol-phosphate mannosyltransferase n=1 Tax=Heliophilum fasciatum TaxID=35700 RepID=A0A4R2S459_9FIRM|nr:glycosyltransferase [Heliophilum fasciatum]MCW2277294.1 glycosyltransferase involved in cell wall biosynthesis [Heliophilum fasciatum]TCP67131.1 dolichol-phosphate mannosyltransferase [Heliophilum fasciatum]